MGSVDNAKHNHLKTVRLQENIHRNKEIMTRNPQKSTRHLTFQLRIKRTPCQRILKHLKMQVLKVVALHESEEKYYTQIMRNCE